MRGEHPEKYPGEGAILTIPGCSRGAGMRAPTLPGEHVVQNHPMTSANSSTSSEQTIPVVEESLRVLRERVETGSVRVHIETDEVTVPVRLEGWSEAVQVERVPVEQTVTERRAP